MTKENVNLDKPPHISNELINYLDALYPDKAPELGDSYEKMIQKAAVASLIRRLKSINADQYAQDLSS